jgi:hypothetical protein
MNQRTFQDNLKFMGELWPKWRLEPALLRLLHQKWGQLHQDKLHDVIEQHRLEREVTPDITAIHKAYCRVTGVREESDAASREITRTKRDLDRCQPIDDRELLEWEEWAEGVLATAGASEVAAAKAHYGLNAGTRRVLAIMVDEYRKLRR